MLSLQQKLHCSIIKKKSVGREILKLCLTLYNPMDCNTPGFLVLHHLLEFAQTHIH